MEVCEVCGSKATTSTGKSSGHDNDDGSGTLNNHSVEFSFIDIGNAVVNDDLSIASQNHSYIEPLIRQLGEYEAGIRMCSCLRQKSVDNSLEKAVQIDQLSKDIASQKKLLQVRERCVQQLQDEKQSLEESIRRRKVVMDSAHLVKRLAADVRNHRNHLYEILKLKRYKKALSLFAMFQVIHHEQEGVSSVLGFPLPNNGYYEECPFEALCTALCHVVHFLDSLSTSLNIPLPHPISPFEPNGPTIAPQYSEHQPHQLLPVSIHSLREEYRMLSWLTLRSIREESSRPNNSVIGLNAYFPEALSLLQANIITLCLRMGLAPQCLLPAHDIVGNLCRIGKELHRIVHSPAAQQLELHSSAPPSHLVVDYQTIESQLLPISEVVQQRWVSRRHKNRTKETVQDEEQPVNEAGYQDVAHPTAGDDEWDIVDPD